MLLFKNTGTSTPFQIHLISIYYSSSNYVNAHQMQSIITGDGDTTLKKI